MKRFFLVFTLVMVATLAVHARGRSETSTTPTAVSERRYDGTRRAERAEAKLHTLISPNYPISSGPDAEFNNILENFIFGEVFYHGSLTDSQRMIILLTVMTTNQNFEQFRRVSAAAIRNGILTPVEIKEVIYQCTPYIGFPKVLSILAEVNEIFTQNGIALPLESQSTVTEETRFARGLEVQNFLTGGLVERMNASVPENQRHIYDYITAMGFGDFFSRGGLDVKTRAMIIFVVLTTLGDCERQLRGHIQGNFNVGNNKEFLIDVVTQSMPYIGFPRALNALALLNEVQE